MAEVVLTYRFVGFLSEYTDEYPVEFIRGVAAEVANDWSHAITFDERTWTFENDGYAPFVGEETISSRTGRTTPAYRFFAKAVHEFTDIGLGEGDLPEEFYEEVAGMRTDTDDEWSWDLSVEVVGQPDSKWTGTVTLASHGFTGEMEKADW